MSDSGAIVGKFVVDGKVSSLGSYLFPAYIDQDSDGDTPGSGAYYQSGVYSVEIPGIDGAYGSNVEGIFFLQQMENILNGLEIIYIVIFHSKLIIQLLR